MTKNEGKEITFKNDVHDCVSFLKDNTHSCWAMIIQVLFTATSVNNRQLFDAAWTWEV